MQHFVSQIVPVSLQVWSVAHVNAHADDMATCVVLPC